MTRFHYLPVLATLLASGCGRYTEFTLPGERSPAGTVSWRWEVRPQPVMTRGKAGSWDGVDTLNPAVVRNPAGFFNLYSGFDGKTWHTGLATSADGITWTRRGKVLSPEAGSWEGNYIASNGSALFHRGEWLYWYQGNEVPQIGLARSADAKRWTRHEGPVLPRGPRGSWDERGAADPYVIRAGSMFYMYYLGQDRARRQRLGVARSDDGVHWQKLRSNPILEPGSPGAFDEIGLGEPAVWNEQGSWWMLYTARDRKESRRLGLARSADGVRWARVTEQPVLSGAQEWNSKVVCDPSVLPSPEGAHVWFGGGDRPEPAEHLNGQIGYALLRLRVEGNR